MAITKVTSGLISADASSIDLNIDAGTLYLDVSENRVGIGTTSPTGKLEISATGTNAAPHIKLVESGDTREFNIYNDGSGNAHLVLADSDDDTPDTEIVLNDNGIITMLTGNSERMRIDSSGNLLVGTSGTIYGTAGRGVLEVNGSSSSVVALKVSDAAAGYMYHSGTNMDVWNNLAGYLRFATNGTERMRIHSSGCVGVGSTVDRSLGTNIGTLVVNGSAGGGLWLSTGDSSSTTSKIYSTTNGSVGELIINQGSGVGGGNILFTHNESATPTMTLQSNKNVLIGDITSDVLTYGKLQVAGGGYTAGFGGIVGFFDTDGSVASSNIIMKVQFIGDSDATGGVFIRFSDSDSTLGQITAANGTQVSYGVSSDERLKENIVDASSQLDLINNIRVREFDWKVNGYHEVGMIAQELNTVVPSVVQEGGDDITEQPWTVDYGKLTPYLIKAIQEQQTIIDNLTTRIETLENA